MSTSTHALLTLHCDDTDPARSGDQVTLLRKNLVAAGIRVSKHLEDTSNQSPGTEAKCDPASLCTLGVTFMTSGAAVALINALRATFVATRSAKVHVKVEMPTRTIDITGDQLSDSRAAQLMELLKQELTS